jgi:hypothetical protein
VRTCRSRVDLSKKVVPLTRQRRVCARAPQVGVVVGTRSLFNNPDLAIAKSRRGIDVTEARTLNSESRGGAAYKEHAFRRYLREHFFTGPLGTLDNSKPFLTYGSYGDK